jgi:hypothetical protein
MRLRIERPKRSRLPLVVTLRRGKGAGYIGGWTAYFAIGAHRPTRDGYGLARLQIGVTRNANLTPTFPWSTYGVTRVYTFGR